MVRFPSPRPRPPYHMHDMILRQPEFVREALGRVREDGASILGEPRALVVTGCGTSFHAALFGAELFQEAFGPGVSVRAVPAYDLLHGAPLPTSATVLGVSHSGATPTTNRALSRARRRGLRTIGICGLPGTDLERAVDATLVIGSVHDESWANTMSYTSALAAFARLAAEVGGARWRNVAEALEGIPRCLDKALGCEPAARRAARVAAQRDRVTFLGSGLDAVTALEGALKIRETCSLPAAAYHPEQFLHGPIVALDRREAVVALASRDDGARLREILRSARAAGAAVTAVGEGAAAGLRLPRTHRLLRPILSVVPLQFLAYHAALERRVDPDVMGTDRGPYSRVVAPLFR